MANQLPETESITLLTEIMEKDRATGNIAQRFILSGQVFSTEMEA